MKIKLYLIVVLAGAVITFNSCKKSDSSNGPSLTPQQVSTQIAANLSQTLYDGFGAFSLNEGLNAPGTLGVIKTKGRLGINSPTDPICNTFADTTLNYSTTANGTTASVKGNIKFAFTCTNGVYSGFNITDNLAIAESNSSLSVSYQLAEDLTLAAVNVNSDSSDASLNGTLSLGGSYDNKTGSKGSGSTNFSYTFTSIIIDDSGDITSGTAKFTTSGSGPNGHWNYAGTVTFLGNYLANLVINGTTYKINIQTGTVVS